MYFQFSLIKKWVPYLVLLLVITVGSYLRIWGINQYYFVGDEALHINLIPILDKGILDFARSAAHPPLFVFLLKLGILVSGTDLPVFFRFIPLISGILIILLAYLIGKQISGSRVVALFTAYLIATSPFLIEHSQLVRGYGLLLFFLTCLIYLLNQDFSNSWVYLVFIVTTALAASTHYSFYILQPGLIMLGYLKIPGQSDFKLNKKRALWILLNLTCLILSLYLIKQFPKQELNSHISGIINTTGSRTFSKSIHQIISLWNRFFGTQIKGFPILAAFLFLGGCSFLLGTRHYAYLIFILTTYLLAIVLDFWGKYPLSAGRHSSYLFMPTLIASVYLTSGLYKKSRTYLLVIFLFILFYQLRNPKTVFIPSNNRWAWGEETYSFAAFSPLSKEIKAGSFLDRPMLVDGGDSDSIILEKNFSLKWELFNTSHQKYYYCNFMELKTKYGLCECLKRATNETGNREFYVMYTQLTDWRSLQPHETNDCFSNINTLKISDKFSVSKVTSRT